MKLSCKKIFGIVTIMTGIILGGAMGGESVWATGSEDDRCYYLGWSIVTTSNTNYHSGRNQMEAGGGSGTEGQSSSSRHSSNRVCYDANSQKIYAEEITNGEPMGLGVQGDNLCLLTLKDGGGYEAAKCITDWKSGSGFDSDKLKNLAAMAGVPTEQIGEGTGGERRGGNFHEAAELGLSEEELNRALNATEVKNVVEEQTRSEQEARDEEEKKSNDGDSCASSGAGGALGWILCPILENLSEAANDVYNDYIDPSLQVNPKLFSGENDGTHTAWEMFRNIANVAFIILLLMVIFSQLTGYGIDNYGIKKILPKLIIGVLLMNLSYLICVLCVDLSNILGGGLKDMFDGLAPTVAGDNVTIEGEIPYKGSTGRSLVSLGLLSVLGVGAGAAAFFNPAVLLSLLVSAIGIAISIFFLFLLLSARQAAVVVLTVISPLAFAAFMLPNTKKYFDKWVRFMQMMLLVYPIAGLLVGGGNFVSSLVVSADEPDVGFMVALTAMLIGVIPILFIPMVIKNSFAAFGRVGNMVAGLGNRASRGAQGALRSTDGYRNAQQVGLARKTRMKAGYDKNYQPTAIGNAKARVARSRFGRAVGLKALQAKRVAAADKQKGVEREEESLLRDVGLDYKRSKNPNLSTRNMLEEELIKARDSGNANSMFAVLDQIDRSNLQGSQKAEMTRKVFGDRKFGNMSLGQQRNFLEDFAKRYSGSFLKKDYEQLNWAMLGGIGKDDNGNDNKVLGLEGWMKNNIGLDYMKDDDVAALGSQNLGDLIAGGKISREQAQRVWAANGNMDDTNRLMLGAYGNAGIMMSKTEAQAAINPGFVGPHKVTPDQIKAYTERAATDTVIRDVDIHNRSGEKKQTDDLGVVVRGGSGTDKTTPEKTVSGGGDVVVGGGGGGATFGGVGVVSVHRNALADLNSSDSNASSIAQTKIDAAQRDLVKTPEGRQAIHQNLMEAVSAGNIDGARAAATNLQQNHFDTFKSDGGGSAQLISDLAGGNVGNDVIRQRVNDGYYSGGNNGGALVDGSGGLTITHADKTINASGTGGTSAPQSRASIIHSEALSGLSSSDANVASAAQMKMESAHNVLTQTQEGRQSIQQGLVQAVSAGNIDGARAAATNLQQNHFDTFKSDGGGSTQLISDLAGGTISNDEIRKRVNDGHYGNTATILQSGDAITAQNGNTATILHNGSPKASTGQKVFSKMSDDKVLEFATRPNAPSTTLQNAAEAEYKRRNPDFNKK